MQTTETPWQKNMRELKEQEASRVAEALKMTNARLFAAGINPYNGRDLKDAPCVLA